MSMILDRLNNKILSPFLLHVWPQPTFLTFLVSQYRSKLQGALKLTWTIHIWSIEIKEFVCPKITKILNFDHLYIPLILYRLIFSVQYIQRTKFLSNLYCYFITFVPYFLSYVCHCTHLVNSMCLLIPPINICKNFSPAI